MNYKFLKNIKLILFTIKCWHKIAIKFFLDYYIQKLTNRREENDLINKLLLLLKSDLQKYDLTTIKSRNIYSLVSKKNIEHYSVASLITKNQLVLPEVIDFSYESKVDLMNVTLNIYKFPQANVTHGSDIIRLNTSECYWYKCHQHFMYKTIPMDKDLYLYDKKNNSVLLTETKQVQQELDNVVSLIGSKDFSWTHFITEYLPKLEIAKKHYYSKKLTVLIPRSLDQNCKEMVNFIKPPNWDIFELDKGYSVSCKNLYYIDCTSWLTDHSETLDLGDTMLYEVALVTLKDFIHNYQIGNAQLKQRSRRIYLRRDSEVRSLTNLMEVDALLEMYNFEVIYGNELTLKEKLEIFSQAEILVGPGSSGFLNIIFCQKDTKIIMFINKNRVWETYFPTIGRFFELDFKYLLSKDEEDSKNPHTSYSIDISKLENEITLSLNRGSHD